MGVEKNNPYAEMLLSVAIAANESLTIEGTMRSCLDRICSLANFPIGHLYLLPKEAAGEENPIILWHLDDLVRFGTFQQVTEFTRFAAESGMIGEVIAGGKSIHVPDVTQNQDLPIAKIAKELGIRSGLAFPILIGIEVVGVLEFYSTELIKQDEQLSKAMGHIGAQLGRVVERSRAIESLQKSEAQFRAIFNRAAIGIFLVDMDGRLIESNGTLQAMLGYSEDELRGRVFIDFTHPDNAMEDWNLFRELIEGKREYYHIEKRYTRKDMSLVWGSLTVSLIRNSRGRPQFAVNMVENITDRKMAEEKLRSFAARLEQSNRELQDFASVASHDLQEPLRKIQAFGDRLKAKCEAALGDVGRDYLNRMQDAAGRMQVLIDDLLSLSRITTKAQPFVQTDLNKIALEVLSNLEVRIEQTDGRVEIDNLPTIEADQQQMRQLFQNLIGNALKFHKDNLPPLVKLRGELIDNLKDRLTDKQKVRITVEDNGIGFDEKYLDRIFTVFQRLHGREVYQGTGIGLAICRRIVERHSGTITANSIPGKGSTFIVTLPVKQSK